MNRKLTILAMSLLVFSLAARAADDPVLGTWKFNAAKSKYNAGSPPKSQVTKYEAAGDAVKLSTDIVDAQGKQIHVEYTAKFDGKQYPYTTTDPAAPAGQTVSMKRIDANTTERTVHLKGKSLNTIRRVISKDGKTMTQTQKGTNAAGQPVNNVAVYDKQ